MSIIKSDPKGLYIMKLAEKTFSGFFEGEEDLYKITDLKVRY